MHRAKYRRPHQNHHDAAIARPIITELTPEFKNEHIKDITVDGCRSVMLLDVSFGGKQLTKSLKNATLYVSGPGK